ncbi:MAG: group I intron-associated PD-(D/E)XK endonuclease [Candidatus Sulfotelmatobacter sp.]
MTWEWRDGGGSSGVQVKSTIYKRRGDGYSLNVMGPKRKKYVPGTVDFFAVLLIPIDDWYIIPFEVMGRKNLSLHFTPKSKRQKYGKYQEAWELLRGPVEIQAGWEKGSGAVAAEAEAGSSLRSE